MDAGIILGGQQPDILGAMDKGRAMAESQIGLNRQNALAELYRTQGAQIAAGDQGALNALAGFDPNASLGVQQNILGLDQTRLGMDATRLGMDQTKQQMAALDATTKRQAEEYAKQIGAEQAAAQAAELEGAVKQALMAPDAATFDAMMTQMGRPELVGQFENREMLASQFMSVAEILKMGAGANPADRYKIVGDTLVDLNGASGPAAVDISGGTPPKADFKDVSDLRKEWIGMPAIKTFQTQSDSFGRIIAASTAPSGAGDVALVYSYMKMLDPGSVVREGEFATAENTAGVDQKIVSIYNKLISGERLTPEMRKDFVDRAVGIYSNAEAEYDMLRKQYSGIAERNGFPVEDALPDFRYSGNRGAGSGSQGFDQAEIDALMSGP